MILSLIIAVFVGAQAVPGPPSLMLITGGVIALAVLLGADKRSSGVMAVKPAGPRSTRLLWIAVGVIAALIAANAVLGLTGANPWWGLLPAVLAFGLAQWLGGRYDDALSTERAGNPPGRR